MLSLNNRKILIALILTITIIITSILGAVLYRPSIHNSTYEDLVKIDDIGEVLGNRILSYLENNPNATIEDLDDIQGIGEKRIKSIKERYR